ncbi:hypothetical protein CN09_18855 [Rhizobium rhizogenes]|nr:hypothetical protein CN09_18855 [Rhizobium rhizogenes]
MYFGAQFPRENGQGPDLQVLFCAGGVRMGSDDAGIDIQVFVVRSTDIAVNMRHQMPLWLQRLKRRKTLFHSPNTSGRSRLGEPVRTIQSTASKSKNMRLSRPGRTARALIANDVG